MKTVIGIDVGGSTTKICGIVTENGKKRLIEPLFVSAGDPITSTYGAFGKFTDMNGIALSDIDKIMMTGVGSSHIKNNIYGLECTTIEEFTGTGLGGLYLSELSDALVVSMGTGTAIVHAKDGEEMKYLGGTGVGGGTRIGLSKLLTKSESVEHMVELANGGDLSKIDLTINDIIAPGKDGPLGRDTTAANFGNVSDLATREDIQAGILNMVFETVAMVAVFAARSRGVKNAVLAGNLTTLPQCAKKFEQINNMGYGVNFIIPKHAQFATVIGTALCG